jgi:hypothetical protein
MKSNKACTGASVVVACGARTGADIVGAMMVAPEHVGVDMTSRAVEGVEIGRSQLHEGSGEVVGSSYTDVLRRILGRALGH